MASSATAATTTMVNDEEGVERRQYCIDVPQYMIDLWTTEIAKLAPRKVKNWKGKSRDTTGRLAIVRYSVDGVWTAYGVTHFVEKADEGTKREMIKHKTPVCEWVPVVSYEAVAQPTTEIPDNEPFDPIDTQAMLDGFGHEQFLEALNENHTGNHGPRNHAIGVPTRAGEPVRG